jgi:hypothetical protein
VNQLPSFNTIHAADLRNLAALKEHLQESLRPLNPFLDLRPVALNALLRFIGWFRGIGDVCFANGSEDLTTFEAELDVTREAVLRKAAECRQENCLVDFGERRWVHARNSS